jgi:hypothetical protein
MMDASSNLELKKSMAEIIGRQLSSVTFVQDYMQFDFDGARLTTYTLPTVSFQIPESKMG